MEPHLFYSCSGGPGEVPGLFTPEEMAVLADSQPQTATTSALRSSLAASALPLWDRVRANLHVVLSMSPSSPAFSERCRLFPGELVCFRSAAQTPRNTGFSRAWWLLHAQAWPPAPLWIGSRIGQMLPCMRWQRTH